MSRRLLIVEPDAAGRGMVDRVLTAEGYASEAVASVTEARAFLDRGPVELAIVDELAGTGSLLEEVRAIRQHYPEVPVVVTGTLLSQRVLLELLRLGAADALPKPYSPTELRASVARVLARAAPSHVVALEYAAAATAVRDAIAAGRLELAAPALARARAVAPLDADTMALHALVAELRGHDADADRAYRAALVLRHDEGSDPPDPYEGLARLRAYGTARPVATLSPDRAGDTLWLVTDPTRELGAGPPAGVAGHTVVAALGVAAAGSGAVYLRDGAGPRAFALLAGAVRAEALTRVLARLGPGPIVAIEPTASRLDVARITAERDALRRRPTPPAPVPAPPR